MKKPKFKLGQEIFVRSETAAHVISWDKCGICDGTSQILSKDRARCVECKYCLRGKIARIGYKVVSPGEITGIRTTVTRYLSGKKPKRKTKISYFCGYGEVLADWIPESRTFPSEEAAQKKCDELNANTN